MKRLNLVASALLLTAAMVIAPASSALASPAAAAIIPVGAASTSETVTINGEGTGADAREAIFNAEQDASRQIAEQGLTDCTKVGTFVAIPIVPGAPWGALAIVECRTP